jgi:flagellar hook assembly protein FlgD
MPAQGRRGIIAGGIIALVLVAFGVFVLPFAFTTPPPIITRFVATRAFTPGNEQGRAIATAAIRLSEPSNVSITIKDPQSGRVVARLADGADLVRTRTLAATWDGRDLDGRQVPDGTYAIDLEARAGDKKFSKSRKIVVDTTPPRPEVTVATTAIGCEAEASAPGETAAVQFSVPTARVQSKPRTIGPKGVADWTWNGRDDRGRLVSPGIQVVTTTARDDRGNQSSTALTCWVAHLVARAVPGSPASGDAVGVVLPGGGDPQVTLSLRQRVGDPGSPAGTRVLGDPIGADVTGPASTARITIPQGTRPADVWLLASTGADAQALIGFGGTG